MRSRPARLTLSTLAWFALCAAAYFSFTLQQEIDQRRTVLRSFVSSARDAADSLADAQAGQQAYVAIGQDPREWAEKVATYLQTAGASIDALRAAALSPSAGPSLLDATTALTQVRNIDRQLLQHLAAEESQAAADAVFSVAADAIAGAVSNVDAAHSSEQQAADEFEAHQLRAQVYALGGAAALAALILALLAFAAPAARDAAAATDRDETADPLSGLSHHVVAPSPAVDAPASASEALHTLAELCTEFGRVHDAAQLKPLLEQAARLLNARGLIVWLGSAAGADLRPVLAYGYSDATLAHIPTLSRLSDNVAAQAYRTGELQIIKSRPGTSQGVVVAPLVGSDGCIGALTAEIRDQGEESDTTRALFLILAAQLSGVLAATADSEATMTTTSRIVAG